MVLGVMVPHCYVIGSGGMPCVPPTILMSGGGTQYPLLDIALWTVFGQFVLYHLSNTYTIKVYEAQGHPSFKNVDMVAIQSSDTQARIFNWPNFGEV